MICNFLLDHHVCFEIIFILNPLGIYIILNKNILKIFYSFLYINRCECATPSVVISRGIAEKNLSNSKETRFKAWQVVKKEDVFLVVVVK